MSTKVKGEKYGLCNITACQSPDDVIWYNHSTRAYYCEKCAKRLNEVNEEDSTRMFGHPLCTRVIKKKREPFGRSKVFQIHKGHDYGLNTSYILPLGSYQSEGRNFDGSLKRR